MRLHLVAAALVLVATLYLRLQRPYVIGIVVTVAMVLAFELMNTAIEAMVDLMTDAHHPLAKSRQGRGGRRGADRRVRGGHRRLPDVLRGNPGRGRPGLSGRACASRPTPSSSASSIVGIATVIAKAKVGRGSALQGGAVSGHAALAFAVGDLHRALGTQRAPGRAGVLPGLAGHPEPGGVGDSLRARGLFRGRARGRRQLRPVALPAPPAACGIIGAALVNDSLAWSSVSSLVVFVGAAAFFAASEAAIVSVSRITARTFAEKGVPGSDRLQKLLVDRNRTLTVDPDRQHLRAAGDRFGVATYLFVELGIPQAPLWSTLRHDGRAVALRRDHAEDAGRLRTATAAALRSARPLLFVDVAAHAADVARFSPRRT